MKKIKSLIATTFIFSMLAGHAAEAGSYYAAINSGVSRLKDYCSNLTTGFTCKDTSLALALDGGYQFNDRFGLELGVAYYGTPKKSGIVSGSTLEITQQMSGLKFSGTASYPVTNAFAFTAKLGVSKTYLNINSTVTPGATIPAYQTSSAALLYGVGVKYRISQSFALQAQYESLGKIGDDTTGSDSLSLLTVGLSYTFGKSRPRAIANTRKAENNSAIKSNSPPAQPPLRVVIFLEQTVPEDKQLLTNAISLACQCQSIFASLYNSNAAVYQISMVQGETFSSFKNTLLKSDASLGIKSLMQGQ